MKKGAGSISQITDPGIRIRTKMSRIPNTDTNKKGMNRPQNHLTLLSL